MPDVSLIIPAYNEALRLPVLFDTLTRFADADLKRAGLRFLEAVIVDDGSSDATAQLLSAAAAENPRLRPVLGRPENRGKGAAIAAGVAVARGDMVLLADVDLSTPIADARALAQAIAGRERAIAIGSRDVRSARIEAPRHRRLLGSCFNLAVRALTGLGYSDTQCGFKLTSSAVARELLRDQISEGFAFDVELLIRARAAGVEVVEVPVSYIHDAGSKLRVLPASLEMARDLVRVAVGLRGKGRAARARLPLEDSRST